MFPKGWQLCGIFMVQKKTSHMEKDFDQGVLGHLVLSVFVFILARCLLKKKYQYTHKKIKKGV
jgi:hypothetical protein